MSLSIQIICESRAFANRKNVIAQPIAGFRRRPLQGGVRCSTFASVFAAKRHHPLTMRCNFQVRHGYAPVRSQEKRSANQHVSRWLDADNPTL
jgi:hypothetical protein